MASGRRAIAVAESGVTELADRRGVQCETLVAPVGMGNGGRPGVNAKRPSLAE